MCIGKRKLKLQTCPECEGLGVNIDYDSLEYGEDCYVCNGTGMIQDEIVEVDGETLHIVPEK